MFVLQVLKVHLLFAMFKKCVFWLRSVAFFNDIVSSEVVEVDPRKRDAFKCWPRPLSPTYNRCFLGLAGYYRKCVKEFISIASPFTALTKKKSMFEWSKFCEKFLKLLKDKLTKGLWFISKIPEWIWGVSSCNMVT